MVRKPSRGSESDTKSVRSYKSGKSSKQQNTGKDSKNHDRDVSSENLTWRTALWFFGILARRFKGTINLLEWFVSLFKRLFEFFEHKSETRIRRSPFYLDAARLTWFAVRKHGKFWKPWKIIEFSILIETYVHLRKVFVQLKVTVIFKTVFIQF